LPIEEKIWFLYFMRFLEISINGIESFLFLYQERQNASAKKDDFLSDCFFLNHFFLRLLDGVA